MASNATTFGQLVDILDKMSCDGDSICTNPVVVITRTGTSISAFCKMHA